MRLSIILPCYNEADNLPLLLNAYCQVWQDLPAELILVDNGSTDHTAEGGNTDNAALVLVLREVGAGAEQQAERQGDEETLGRVHEGLLEQSIVVVCGRGCRVPEPLLCSIVR